MTVTLNLPPHIEQEYLAEAQARGLPLDEVMAETLVAARQLAAGDSMTLNQEEWLRELEAWGERNAHKNLPILSNEALRRESMYENRI